MIEQWQELKETIIEMRDNDGTGTQQEVCKFLANYMEILEKQIQEPKTGEWIPVSERLPEDSGEYLVTVIDEDVETYKHMEIAWYAHPKDYDVEEGDWRELMFNEKVIAWMPLPEPYKEEGAE